MATEVFNLEVQIKTTPALQGLRSLNKELDTTKRKAAEVGKQNGLGTLKRSVDGVSASFKGLGGVLAGLGIAKITTETITAIAEYERLQVVLETVTGSASGAAAAIKTIDAASRSTGIAQSALADSFIKLEAAGLKPTLEQLQLFGDVASVTTDQLGSLQAITDLYARTTAGGLGLEEVNRLADRGIPVFDILNKRLGISRLQISELGKTADGAKLILRNLEAGFKDAFSGASAKQLNTLGGQISLFRQNLTALATGAGTAGLNTGLTDLTKTINDLLVAIRPITNALGGGIGDAISETLAVIKTLIVDLGKLAIAFLVLKGIIGFNQGLIDFSLSAGKAATSAAGLGRELLGVFRNIVPASLAGITGAVKGLIGPFVQLAKIISTTKIGAFLARFAIIPALLNPITATIAAIVSGLFLFRNTMISVGDKSASVGEIVVYAVKSIYNSFLSEVAYIVDVMKAVIDIFDQLIKRIPGVDTAMVGLAEVFKATGKAAQDAWAWTKEKVFGDAIRNINSVRPVTGAGNGRGDGAAELAARRKLLADQNTADRAAAQELSIGKVSLIAEAIRGLKQEASLIGKSAEEAEKLNKVLEIQNQIRQKVLQSNPAATEKEIAAAINLGTGAAEIRAAVASKYAKQRIVQFNQLKSDTTEEIKLLGLSANEIEKQTKLREILVSQGRELLATDEERQAILNQITRGQEARVNASLNATLEGLNKETAQLKLSNREREIAIALQDAATAAGLKGSAELSQVRRDEIRSAILNRQNTVVDVEGQKQIDSLREQVSLNSILNDKERDRIRTQRDLYKAIDPDGKGENITRAQKGQIAALLETIAAQEQLIEINNKINDQFRTLGDAVTKAILGGTDAVRQLKLELIKLAALEAFKRFAGGSRTGSTGSFLGGLIDGISGARAQGGPVNAGGTYLVGEKGPELVKFGQAGYVVPNMDAQTRVSSRSGNVVVQVNPTFQNNGNINSTEDLNGLMAQWGEGVARQTEKFVREQFGPSGLAYN